MGVGLCCLVAIFSLAAFFLPRVYDSSAAHFGSGLVSVLGTATIILAFLVLGVGSTLVTVFMVKAASVINQYGNQIGVYAYQGNQFMALTWTATTVMLVAIFAWSIETCCHRRARRMGYVEKHVGSPIGSRGARWRVRW
jgi:hypothetical protein